MCVRGIIQSDLYVQTQQNKVSVSEGLLRIIEGQGTNSRAPGCLCKMKDSGSADRSLSVLEQKCVRGYSEARWMMNGSTLKLVLCCTCKRHITFCFMLALWWLPSIPIRKDSWGLDLCGSRPQCVALWQTITIHQNTHRQIHRQFVSIRHPHTKHQQALRIHSTHYIFGTLLAHYILFLFI